MAKAVNNRNNEDTEVLDRNAVVRKDNNLITAKYKATLLENQLTSICLSRVKEQNGEYISTVSSSEIRQLFSLKDNNSKIYRRLFTAAKNMGGRTLAAEDGSGNFQVISVIQSATYKDGVFSVRFNDELKPYLFDLQGKYTSYNLANVLNFQCDYSFRIYELLKKDAFRISKDEPVCVVEYGLAEFKCMVGVIDMDTERIRKEMQKNFIDWDRILEISPEKSYPRWGDFKRRVIDRAREEINAQCDICFDYEPIKSGRGARVIGIRFFVKKNDISRDEIYRKKEEFDKLNNEYEQLSMFKPSPELLAYIGHNDLKKKDITMLLDEAGGDNQLVIRSIKDADRQEHIRNYVGWIRTCIRKGGYDAASEVMEGSKDKAGHINRLNREAADDADAHLSTYWNAAKLKNTEKFIQFENFLIDNHMDLETFEAVNTEAECGDKYIRWIKGETIELM